MKKVSEILVKSIEKVYKTYQESEVWKEVTLDKEYLESLSEEDLRDMTSELSGLLLDVVTQIANIRAFVRFVEQIEENQD